jgi:hypothetical protein
MGVSESDRREIAATWIAMHHLPRQSPQTEVYFWAFERLSDLVRDDPEEAWGIMEMVRRLDGADVILSNLGAGPLEDLLVAHGDKFIDRVECLAKSDEQFAKLLGVVWKNRMSEEIWKRVKAVAAPSW